MHKWADELPPELLGLIVKKLASNFMDILRFEVVCSSWNRAARWYTSTAALTPQSPWLMLPTLQSNGRWSMPPSDGDVKGICFFSLAENKDYKMDWKASQAFPVDVDSFPGSSSHDEWLVGNSSHGWLVLLEVVASMLFHEIRGIRLFNPISRKSKTLPPLCWRGSSIRKVVLSSNPSRNNNFVVVIHDTEPRPTMLTFYLHGRGEENAAAGAWTDLEDLNDKYGGYFDILLRNNGHLFALSFDHSIEVWDLGTPIITIPPRS
ncbi:hypothetical protein ACE6H2_001415 [Prunus campanulata]